MPTRRQASRRARSLNDDPGRTSELVSDHVLVLHAGSGHRLPEGFRHHDLRHHFASLLIASGSDGKVVQARVRHASAKRILDTYGHLWPDSDESTRAAVGAVLAARADSSRTIGLARP